MPGWDLPWKYWADWAVSWEVGEGRWDGDRGPETSSTLHWLLADSFSSLFSLSLKTYWNSQGDGRRWGTKSQVLMLSIQIRNFPFVKNYPSFSDCRHRHPSFSLFYYPDLAQSSPTRDLFSQNGTTNNFLLRQMEVQKLNSSSCSCFYLPWYKSSCHFLSFVSSMITFSQVNILNAWYSSCFK